MNKHPVAIEFWVSDDEQITDDEIDALSVPGDWKVIGDSFKNIGKSSPLQDRHGECSI